MSRRVLLSQRCLPRLQRLPQLFTQASIGPMSDTIRLAKEIDETSRKQSLLLGQLLDRLDEKEANEQRLLAKIRVLESNHSLLLSKISECPSCSGFNDQRFYSSQTQVSMTQESQLQRVPSSKRPKYQPRSPLKEITNLEPTLNMNVNTNSFDSSSSGSIEYVAVASPELITSDIEEIISDSQPDVTHDDILTHNTPKINPYITPITDSKIKIDLSTNPKFNREWFLEDFKRNPASKSSHTDNCMCNDCSKLFQLAPVSNLKNGIKWDSNSAESGETPSKRSIPAGFKRRHGNGGDNTIWDDPCTPPGFNRSEFPTTQELKEDRKESSKRVKSIALYRLKEALKVDEHGKQIGKFIFKNNEFNVIVNNGNFLT